MENPEALSHGIPAPAEDSSRPPRAFGLYDAGKVDPLIRAPGGGLGLSYEDPGEPSEGLVRLAAEMEATRRAALSGYS